MLPASAVADSELRDLSLPDGCLVTLLVRGHDLVAPRGSTQLRVGDHVCVLAAPDSRPFLDLVFGGEAGGET